MQLRKLLFMASFAAAMIGRADAVNVTPHYDKSGGSNAGTIAGVAPIYLYNSVGTPQFGLSVATATSLTVPTGATIAQICVETAGVRYRDDGTAPTASSGMPVPPGTCFQYAGPLSSIQFIAQSGSPTIDVLYYVAN